MRFWPKSLAGQLIAVLLPVLAAAQVAGFVILADERVWAIRAVARDEFLTRMASVARLIGATPPADHQEIIEGMAAAGIRFWLSEEPPADIAAFRREAWQRLDRTLPVTEGGERPLGSFEANRQGAQALPGTWSAPPAGDWNLPRAARFADLDSRFGVAVAAEIAPGRWLNGAFAKPYYGQIWRSQSIVAIGLTALLLSGLAVLMARRITRPIRRLSAAAESLGRGEEVAPLPEEGPDDVRRLTAVFNVMQDRLKRFVSDRTTMLAAIGHDLRTPITSLRLRAEFVRDTEERDKLLSTLDDMQTMVEATLSFARDQAVGEPTRLVDVAALAEMISDDLADLGYDVTFTGEQRIPYRCRPTALGRAIRNLVENAVRYGERARVSAGVDETGLRIVVDDDGPGLATPDIDEVFKPFVRLETSRSRETGGTGLGLSIARTIARSHGGDVFLANRPGGGLSAVIRLPAPQGSLATA